MRIFLLPLLCFGMTFQIVFAQKPMLETSTNLERVDQLALTPLDNEALYKEELEKRQPGRAHHFAQSRTVKISPNQNGTWEFLDNGLALWRVRIYSPGAKSINVGFEKFKLSPNAKVILYSKDTEEWVGPLTKMDNEWHNQYWSPIIFGDEIVVEAQIPYDEIKDTELELSSVNHDFVGIGSILTSRCNVDVACGAEDGFPEIDEYRDIIQSVGMYALEGTSLCSGALINNTDQDCRPLFLTANHCGITADNAPSVVVYWNYQNSTCRTPETITNGGSGDGALDDSNSGAQLLANYASSDFALIELDDPVSETANAYFAGWSLETTVTDSALGIHHPNTEEKRICFDYDKPMLFDGSISNEVSGEEAVYVSVENWDLGTTEGGSSGSPLFNKRGLIMGQLFAGLRINNDCSLNEEDVYGWLYRSWEGGGSPENRLKDWLDPSNSLAETLEGQFLNSCGLFSVVGNGNNRLLCSGDSRDTLNFELQVGENLVNPVKVETLNIPNGLNLSGLESEFSPAFNDIVPLAFDGVSNLLPGHYNIEVQFTDSENKSVIQNLYINIGEPSPVAPALIDPVSESTQISITPLLEWSTVANTDSYEIQIAEDAQFENIVFNQSGLENTVLLVQQNLEIGTNHFWRVRGENICGGGDWSTPFSFTVVDNSFEGCLSITAVDLPIELESIGENSYESELMFPFGDEMDGRIVNEVRLKHIRGTHTWLGDLTFKLTSPEGTTVTLIEEECFDISFDFDIQFGDDGPTHESIPCPYNDGQIYQAKEALSAFIGEQPKGNWILEVEDSADEDGGQLLEWTLEICSEVVSSINEKAPDYIQNRITLSPNPATDLITITHNLENAAEIPFEILNVNGQRILQKTVASNQTPVNIAGLPSGVYFVKFYVEEYGFVLKRMVVQ